MIPRTLATVVRKRAATFRALTVTGPRQSGKTTLCRELFPSKSYVSLEAPHERQLAQDDPRAFLARFPSGAVLDEVQRVPDLLSYLQGIVDERDRAGDWVLTGSYHFGLLRSITQSLAGRTSLLTLLPLSQEEHRLPSTGRDPLPELFTGGYPEVRARSIGPHDWFSSYVATYLERDVREVLRVGDLSHFHTFLQLCAGRAGQLLNLSSLGADCGISHHTAREWISVLEASYVAFRLQPLHRSRNKRLVKSPKLYFHDTGLLCHLLDLREPAQIATSPHRGAIFENFVVSEIQKHRLNRGLPADLAFFRDHAGREVDLVVGSGRSLLAVEIKSSRTFDPSFVQAFGALEEVLAAADPGSSLAKAVVHGGEEHQDFRGTRLLPWDRLHEQDWTCV